MTDHDHDYDETELTEAAWRTIDDMVLPDAFHEVSGIVSRIMGTQPGADCSYQLRVGFVSLLRGWAEGTNYVNRQLVDWDEIARRLLLKHDPSFVESWSTLEGIDAALEAGELELLGCKRSHVTDPKGG